jgi:hypothetical protein
LIPYANEIGVFYVRYPNEKQGRITGIVAKEFLIVTGDGVSTIAQLLKKTRGTKCSSKRSDANTGKNWMRYCPVASKPTSCLMATTSAGQIH